MKRITTSALNLLRLAGESLEPLLVTRTASGARSLVQYLSTGNRQQRYRYRQQVKRLELDGLIFLSGEKIELTEKGRQLLQDYGRKEIIVSRGKWEGIWHLVAYDIPNTKKKERDAFRRQLARWGFRQVQESIWVIPYDCKEEVAVVAQEFGVAPYVLYMNAAKLPAEQRYLKAFGLLRQ